MSTFKWGKVITLGSSFCGAVGVAGAVAHSPAVNAHVTTVHCNDCKGAREALSTDGAVVLKGVATANMVSEMKKILGIARASGQIGNARFIESSKGRHHLSMLNTSLEPLARDLQNNAEWHQIVWRNTRSEEDKNSQTLGLTMAQLLDSRPGSASQIWHADNYKGGWTIVVAIDKVTESNGPTALQLQSHIVKSRFDNLLDWLTPTKIAKPQLDPGDVLIYSSSLIHRGEPNNSGENRPILVYRYDDPKYPPPGLGALGTQLVALYGLASSYGIE